MSDPIAPEAPVAEPKPAAAEVIQLPDDHPLVKTLAAQKEQLQKLKAERAADAEKASKWDAAEAAQLSAIEKAEKRAEAAEKELNSTRLEALRASVALAKGLTPTQAKRLIGSTSEELEADADELLADIKNTKPGSAPSSEGQGKQGEPVGQTKQITSRDQLKNMSREEQLAAYKNGELKALTG
jgi:hypothetical protein